MTEQQTAILAQENSEFYHRYSIHAINLPFEDVERLELAIKMQLASAEHARTARVCMGIE